MMDVLQAHWLKSRMEDSRKFTAVEITEALIALALLREIERKCAETEVI